MTLANCASGPVAGGRHPSELKYGVRSSPRVIPEGEPIPKGGGREMVGQPYVVAGRTYRPHPGRGYDREGWASWYGTAFHGRLTANGEIFDRNSVAAAHPTLPLPSLVRVTNVVNGRSMIVRVNDRGPYERSRVLDVSERAADALGFRHKGTGRVRVQYVGMAPLEGSDDERLMATLRTDGGPASLEPARGRVMVATAAAEDGRKTTTQAGSGGQRNREDRRFPAETAEPPRVPRALASGAQALPATPPARPDRRPTDIRPPGRPNLAGIY